MDFDKLIDRHFEVMMSHKAASIQHYLDTGKVSGTLRNTLRHMLSDALSEGKNDDTGDSNCTIHGVMQRSELLTDFMEMIEEGGMIQFDKPKLLNQFKNRQ